ncbi:hypothetical protein [Pantoea sp.]|uniref:hypothetical protein n=1 Tax=Pantoea sp. TaxID=69393 RepID=UPI0028A6DB69|nr:hypothetical protein [Pantoea sp.]
MVTQYIEKAVFDLAGEYNGRRLFTFKRYPHFPEDFSKKHDLLTIQLLIDSAKAGRWPGRK